MHPIQNKVSNLLPPKPATTLPCTAHTFPLQTSSRVALFFLSDTVDIFNICESQFLKRLNFAVREQREVINQSVAAIGHDGVCVEIRFTRVINEPRDATAMLPVDSVFSYRFIALVVVKLIEIEKI